MITEVKIFFSIFLLNKKTRKSITDLEIHKGDQVELISTAGFKNLIHIPSFDTNVFAQLITQTTIHPIAIKRRRLGV